MLEPIENDSPEMSFRRGYQHGVIDVFRAIERLFDPASGGFARVDRKRHLRMEDQGNAGLPAALAPQTLSRSERPAV
jgi:hypothetical protein